MLRALILHDVNRNLAAVKHVNSIFRRELNYIPIKTANKITVGHTMTQAIEKKRQKYVIKKVSEGKYMQNIKSRDGRDGDGASTRRLLIAADNPYFHHYTNQVYKDFSERNLASYGWKNRMSRGKYFTINAIGSHPSLIDVYKTRTKDDKVIEFDNMGLNECLTARLKSVFNIVRPTYIQYQSLIEILKRDGHCLLIAETGGGKTLCYALPLLEYAIRIRHRLSQLGLERTNRQPIGLVIVPTRELAFQVYDMFKKLIVVSSGHQVSDENKSYDAMLNEINVVVDLHPAQVKAKQIVSGKRVDTLDEATRPVDVLITLPGQLEERFNRAIGPIDSTYLRACVVDEADTLFDDSFSPVTLKCLTKLAMNLTLPKQINSDNLLVSETDSDMSDVEQAKINFYISLDENLKDPSTQLIFTSATVPRDLQRILQSSFDWQTQLKTIMTNRVHRLMLHVPQRFFRTNGMRRPQELLEIIRKEFAKNNTKRTMMVFCHKTSTAAFVYKFLEENGVEGVDLLIKKINNRQREEVVRKFFADETRVLVCTDIASRGWNTLQVSHVVNFEMPQFIADYVHRVGRVGRLGSTTSGGLVTNFIVTKPDTDLVWNIERSIRLGSELEQVDANIKKLYNKHGKEMEESAGTAERRRSAFVDEKSDQDKHEYKDEEEDDEKKIEDAYQSIQEDESKEVYEVKKEENVDQGTIETERRPRSARRARSRNY